MGHLGLGHPDGGGLWAAHNVVEEQVEVADLLLAEAQRRWRDASIVTRLFGGG